jgi:hypothetical protein
MPFDVFISYATEDRIVANAACARLESAGIRCWIAPRDILAGRSYGEAIIEAIHEVKVMVLVFSSSANTSDHVPKEVERAVSNGLAIVPLRIEDVAPTRSLDYFIGSIHWLDAMTPPLERHLDQLLETVQKLLPSPADRPVLPAQPAAQPPAVHAAAGAGTGRAISIKTLAIGAAAFVVIALAAWAAFHFWPKPPGVAGSLPSAANPFSNSSSGSSPAGNFTASDPIVGCYHWFNNVTVIIQPNGTFVGGPLTGNWRSVNAAQRAYVLNWPEGSKPVFRVNLSSDQRYLSGINQYEYPISGTRAQGTSGLVGSWNLSSNVLMVVLPDGTFSAGPFSGTWRTINAAQGTYSLTWPPLIDGIALSANGMQISGVNQYGVAISGTRTQPCGVH